jgi:lysophospholipid acyltransferase (LPLAT)-like uncharacterized protein
MRDVLALDSWDRFEIPQPFTKAAMVIGEPISIPEDAGDEALPALSEHLETVLNDLTAQAEVEVFAEVSRAGPGSPQQRPAPG